MIQIGRLLSQGYRRLKDIKPESWVNIPPSTPKILTPEEVPHLEIKDFRDIKRDYNRGLEQQPIPVSPVLGPIRVEDPKVACKKYRWCSCGMSYKQPFCDNSHEGTLFKPLKFTIQQKVQYVELCGCKLSSNKPFCDGKTCKQLQQAEQQKTSSSQKV